jgi:hypothetical protein
MSTEPQASAMVPNSGLTVLLRNIHWHKQTGKHFTGTPVLHLVIRLLASGTPR